jgi:hypothetical protein
MEDKVLTREDKIWLVELAKTLVDCIDEGITHGSGKTHFHNKLTELVPSEPITASSNTITVKLPLQ